MVCNGIRNGMQFLHDMVTKMTPSDIHKRAAGLREMNDLAASRNVEGFAEEADLLDALADVVEAAKQNYDHPNWETRARLAVALARIEALKP